jgi:hypothetical protein
MCVARTQEVCKKVKVMFHQETTHILSWLYEILTQGLLVLSIITPFNMCIFITVSVWWQFKHKNTVIPHLGNMKQCFNVLLTEHHGTILVNHQLDAQILYFLIMQSSLNLRTGQPLIESDHTRCCVYTILPPEDEHNIAQNMYRTVILLKTKNLCIKLVID